MRVRTFIMLALVIISICLWKNREQREKLAVWVHDVALRIDPPSAADRKKELERLVVELDTNERLLSTLEEQRKQIAASHSFYCPITKQRSGVHFLNDPRPALREKIEGLQARIKKLEQESSAAAGAGH